MSKIYALIDRGLIDKYSINLKDFCNFLNDLNIPIAQYRNKNYNKTQIVNDLNIIKSHFKGTLIINDYIDFISLADGLHIGQEDLIKYGSINKIRDIIKNKILGLSTHNLEEIKRANSFNLDYIGLGAYRETSTKDVSNIKGKELLEIAKSSVHKVALIGGITLEDDFSNYPQIYYKVIGSNLFKKYLSLQEE